MELNTNEHTSKKILGIIGGMGPMATVDIFQKIVAYTDAKVDSDHIHVIIDNNPTIPDRTRAILMNGESPVPMIRKSAKKLIRAGAQILLLPCNTSHAYYDEIIQDIGVAVMNMVYETVRYVKMQGIKKVGLLATDGTVKSAIYEKAFHQQKIETILPSSEGQKAVMDMIYRGVKAGNAEYSVVSVMNTLEIMKRQGIESFVLGCTELPIAFKMYHIHDNYIDPATVLAKAAIIAAGYDIKTKKINGVK